MVLRWCLNSVRISWAPTTDEITAVAFDSGFNIYGIRDATEGVEMVAEDGLEAKRSVSPNEETADAESDFPKSVSNNWLGRGRVGRRSQRPEDCGPLILAAELYPSKSRFSFELGKVSFNTSLTYFVHRLHTLARITRDSVPDTVPREKRCPTGENISLNGGAV